MILCEKYYKVNFGERQGVSVFDDDTINTDNQSSHFGYRGYFRRIKCTNIDPNLFNGL